MATLTVRGFDDELHARLRVRAAQHGRSMEAEVRAILGEQLSDESSYGSSAGLGSRIHARFAEVDGIDLDVPERRETPRAPEFEE